jgi:hypothetical protein
MLQEDLCANKTGKGGKTQGASELKGEDTFFTSANISCITRVHYGLPFAFSEAAKSACLTNTIHEALCTR